MASLSISLSGFSLIASSRKIRSIVSEPNSMRCGFSP